MTWIVNYRKQFKTFSLSLVGDWLLSGSMDGLLALHSLHKNSVIVEKGNDTSSYKIYIQKVKNIVFARNQI